MKQLKRTIINVLMLCLFPSTILALPLNITESMALSYAQKEFEGKDVDYFLIPQSDIHKDWTIFVDAEPMKGWEHECYLLTIPRQFDGLPSKLVPQKQLLKLPPDVNMKPLLVKNRYGENVNEKPNIESTNAFQIDSEAAAHTYAVILSGGINKNANHERYWNDCSFIYQTLKRTYGIPQSNISVIMSDGTNPADDMRTVYGELVSSPLDLDGDGVNDIEYAATENNVSTVLAQLNAKLNRDDHLFFFVIDHGGTIDEVSQSYICLWNSERLYDYKLAEYLKPLLDKGVTANVVLGQCYSGGFIDDLSAIGCVVATACSGDEPSYACTGLLYDEFVYRWTSAVNGMDTSNNIVNADFNNDKYISMDEAFQSAKNNDEKFETPQFYAGAESVGQYLSFNSLPKSDDIFIKDNPQDVGDEPNLTTTMFWQSPSICVRNNPDDIFVHENPVYSDDHRLAFVYVRVYNRN